MKQVKPEHIREKTPRYWFLLIFILPIAVFLICLGLFWTFGKLFFPLPMEQLHKSPSTIVLDRNGEILRGFTAPDEMWRIPSDIDGVSPKLQMAVINYEDRWFRFHPGVNPVSLVRAAITNIRAGRIVCGGSTITMQVARMMEPKPRTFKSKLIEIIRAFQLELSFSKAEILALYFNMAPYGSNIVGSATASHFYFNKDQKDISLGEAALLAAIPNSPTALRPDAQLNDDAEFLVKFARDKVLHRLFSRGKITREQLTEALSEPISNQRYPMPFIAPQLARELKQAYPRQSHIVSTIDKNMQIMARDILRKRIEPLKAHGVTNGAVVIMDTKTHEVLAMVASADFFDEKASGQVNGAMAPRSPGSALKPFVYALALDRGIASPESMLSDVPVDYSGYCPINYDEKFSGAVTVRDALTHSLNVPAVNMSAKLGDDGIYGFLKKAGITTLKKPEEHYGLSLILGGCEVTLLELTNLYAGLANMGEFASYKLMQDSGQSDNISTSLRLLREGTAFILNEILAQVERPDLPSCWESSVNLPKVAWKTGTSYGHKDAWSIGYSPQFTIGVWVGNFNAIGSPAIIGSEAAAPLLFDLFNAITEKSPKRWYVKPAEVERREVCALSGMPMSPYCQHSRTEYYIPGISPNQPCDIHRAYAIDKKTGERLCSRCRIGRDYEMRVYTVFPPEIATWIERNGVVLDKVPEHYSECSRVIAGANPIIHSPSAECDYVIRDGVDLEYQKILLEASVSNDARKIFWFLNSKLIYHGSPTEKVFITPVRGKHKLICMDDAGRSTEMKLVIR